MTDDEDVAAEQRAYRRRFPFMVIGALALLIGVGFIATGLHYWPWDMVTAAWDGHCRLG